MRRRNTLRLAAVGALTIAIMGATVAAMASPTIELRTVIVGHNPDVIALDVRAGHLFVASEDGSNHSGRLDMVDARTGQLLRTLTLPTGPSRLTIDEQRQRVFAVIPFHNTVIVLDSRSGQIVRTLGPYNIPGSTTGNGSIRVAVNEKTGRTFISSVFGPSPRGSAIELVDTTQVTTVKTIASILGPTDMIADDQTGHVFVLSNGTLGQNRMGTYVGSAVSMLDGTTGAVLRRIPLTSPPMSIVIDARRSRAIVLTFMNSLCVLDTKTGRVLAAPSLGVVAGPMILDEATGRLFIASTGRVLMLDVRTGTVLATIPIRPEVTALAVSERAGRVYLVHGHRASVSVLDTATGALVRTFRVAQDPAAVAIDDRTARVFVASDDLSAGYNSGVWFGSGNDTVFTQVVKALRNTVRAARIGWTGSVTTFDLRTVR